MSLSMFDVMSPVLELIDNVQVFTLGSFGTIHTSAIGTPKPLPPSVGTRTTISLSSPSSSIPPVPFPYYAADLPLSLSLF